MSHSELAELTVGGSWEGIFSGERKAQLEALLPDYILGCRWFGGKARAIESVTIKEAVPFPVAGSMSYITLIQVNYRSGPPQTYVLPLSFAPGGQADRIREQTLQGVVARLRAGSEQGVLYDASWDESFARALLDVISDGRTLDSSTGQVSAWPTESLENLKGASGADAAPSVMRVQQSNTSIKYGNRLILKLFRRLEEGTSPDLEVSRFLGERGFANTPPLAGALEYGGRQGAGERITLAILQGFVSNKGDSWEYTLSSLNDYFGGEQQPLEETGNQAHPLDLLGQETPAPGRKALGSYLESARLLGKRTAEMHVALASGESDPAFAPYRFTPEYQREVYGSMRGLTDNAFELLTGRLGELPDIARTAADTLLDRRAHIEERFAPFVDREIDAVRTRIHGDYHLGQVLWTGTDFVIIDFEGEPVRSLAERRRKHSPLKDVAGMLRSFHYASYTGLLNATTREKERGSRPTGLEQWANAWYTWVSVAYLECYLDTARESGVDFLPLSAGDLRTLLDAHLLEKAVYELIYELNNRPDWVRIPMQGILQLLG